MNFYNEVITDNGTVLSRQSLSKNRRKKGQCETCGIQCFNKTALFRKMVPKSVDGDVLDGRCLHCHPLDLTDYSIKQLKNTARKSFKRVSPIAMQFQFKKSK